VEIKRDKLIGSLTKIKGSGAEVPVSGVSGGFSPVEGVVLLGNQLVAREVGLREEASVNRIVTPDDWQEAGAQAASTSCEGWGYQCCDSGTMAGSGEQELRVLDCRDNCYPACLMRPALVYFNSDPLMEPKARTIKVASARATITFGFEVMDEDSSIAAVTLDFGDGDQYTAKNINEVVKHEYICGEGGGCNFTAKLEATDSDALTLNQERLQTIQVVLGN